jgi:hypothetical protein
MVTGERKMVLGIFADRLQARDAIQAIKEAGFAADSIGILMPQSDEHAPSSAETGAGEAVGGGLLAGGILGGLAGWLVGLVAFAVPGVGPVLGAGILASALTGAALGAGVGGLAVALAELGLSKDRARWYEQRMAAGGTLVTVLADGRAGEAHNLLRRHGAADTDEVLGGRVHSV